MAELNDLTLSSVLALEKVSPHLKKIRGDVFVAVRNRKRGRTADELLRADFKSFNPYTIRPRLTELVDFGLLYVRGDMRLNRRGNNEMVYRVPDKKRREAPSKKMCTHLPKEAEPEFRRMCAQLRRKWI